MSDKKAMIDLLVAIAVNEIGTREEGGNNTGKDIVTYQKASWLAPGAWPWCAAFICWVILEWLESSGVRRYWGLKSQAEVDAWRFRSARAFDIIDWATKMGFKVLPETTQVLKGDIIVFDFSHAGIATHDQKFGSSIIQTVEGNTNGKGERDSETGDGVWPKQRDFRLIKAVIRMIE